MANRDFMDYMQGRGQKFNPYAAGNKRYGPEGRSAPNVGATSDQAGYTERDNRARLMRNAALRKMKAYDKKNYASADALRPLPRTPYQGRAGGY
jgi:hypothetical protein